MYAKVIADSISMEGHRLTTMEVEMNRFVLPEFNTHRMFSRNSASSRAIPVAKQLKRVREDMAEPLIYPAEQKGMQGGEPVESEESARITWQQAGQDAADHAEVLAAKGVHKSVTNRLLEPFMWHTVVVTSTEWENFYEQRCSPLAQPEIRAVAEMMREAQKNSTPSVIRERDWHLPYVETEDVQAVLSNMGLLPDIYQRTLDVLVKVSAARCARVSYLTHDGKRDYMQDIDLYHRLVEAQPAHWSPLEHVATPWSQNVDTYEPHFYLGATKCTVEGSRPRVGNLLGWRSLRTQVQATQ